MNKHLSLSLLLLGLVAHGGSALAQPLDDDATPRDPYEAEQPLEEREPHATPPKDDALHAPADQTPASDETPSQDVPRDERNYFDDGVDYDDDDIQEEPARTSDEKPAPPFPEMRAPQLLSVPTAHLLPAAVIYGTASVDTGGSFGGSLRVGLGDVGEFGLETSPLIRMIPQPGARPDTIQPLIFATFKMGVAEDRLVEGQPALALGFRKSFAREASNNDIRAAAIELTASKTLGSIALHGGAVFWDAEMQEGVDESTRIALHDDEDGARRQIRPFGGIEAEPIKNAQLLVDLAWVPLFRPGEANDRDRLSLRPALSWGVRYVLSKQVSIESGVRVPDIGDANLLDAQIFGQLSIASDRLRRGLGLSD